jgi:hypothetical protein
MVTKKTIQHEKVIGIAAILIILVIIGGFYFGSRVSSTGQAVFIGNQPYLGEIIDLTKEEFVTFTVLPDEETSILFSTALFPYDPAPQIYTFSLFPLNDEQEHYVFQIYQTDQRGQRISIASDILYVEGRGDSTQVYLDDTDAVADVDVTFDDDAITLTNIHFLSPDNSFITFLNTLGEEYGPVIRIAAGEDFVAIVNASSSAAPDLSANMGAFSNIRQIVAQNYTEGTFILTTPEESTVATLDLVATVGAQETHSFYTLAIGNVAYALREEGFPGMVLTLNDDNEGELEVTLDASTEWQPFALPCGDSRGIPIRQVFDDPNVERVYSYGLAPVVRGQAPNIEPLVWDPNPGFPSEIEFVTPDAGYFVKLRQAEETVLDIDCDVKILEAVTVPTPDSQTKRFRAGWTLFSLPGIIPQPLTTFTSSEEFTLYECSGINSCPEVDVLSPLDPGKPYWVRAENPFTMQYVLQGIEE